MFCSRSRPGMRSSFRLCDYGPADRPRLIGSMPRRSTQPEPEPAPQVVVVVIGDADEPAASARYPSELEKAGGEHGRQSPGEMGPALGPGDAGEGENAAS